MKFRRIAISNFYLLSPSSRGRGLKYCKIICAYIFWIVALFTRAWIEIINGTVIIGRTWSPSSRGRGLKSKYYCTGCHFALVALFTRAWIEIIARYGQVVLDRVALFTRAWIEILSVFRFGLPLSSRPLHEGVD